MQILTNNEMLTKAKQNMKATPAQRLKQFRTAAQIETKDLEEITGISKSLIEKMETGQMAISEKSAKTLKDKVKLPAEWLLHGIGDMTFELQPVNPYRDYLVKKMEGEIEFYRGLLTQMTGGKKSSSFLQALNGTGLSKRSLGAAAA